MFKAPDLIEPPSRTAVDNRIVSEAELFAQVAVKEKRENVFMAC